MSHDATLPEESRLVLRPRRRWIGPLLAAAVASVALLAITGGVIWDRLFREVPVRYDDPEEHYKYGAIGNSSTEGLPYYIWMVLPRIFPEHLPGNGGYASMGMVWEQGHEWPVGFSVQRVGFPRIAPNCASCHSAAVRFEADAAPAIFSGGTSHQFDPQAYLMFLSACARDDRFNADIIMEQLNDYAPLDPIDRLLYRFVIIPRMRRDLLRVADTNSWMFEHGRPRWGPGRIDPFNPVKFNVLGMDPTDDDTVGNSDMQSLWNLEGRDGGPFHWDGLNSSLREVVISSAIGDGSRPATVVLDDLIRLERFIEDLDAPKFPEGRLDPDQVQLGREVYDRADCHVCHDADQPRTATIIPLDEIGTDPQRHRLWGNEAARRYNDYARSYSWDFDHFVGTDGSTGKHGYLSPRLDGLWLRAPYLHNGSVPTLRDLLEPPDRRPTAFYRGNDRYDPDRGGFVADVAQVGERQPFFEYDTRLKGNSNGGHRYGLDLSDEEKDALVQYLLSL